MDNKKNTFDIILKIFGILTLVVIVYHLFNAITAKTKTSVISEEGLKALQNPEQAKKIRQAVDEYHETGDWGKTKLESIL